MSYPLLSLSAVLFAAFFSASSPALADISCSSPNDSHNLGDLASKVTQACSDFGKNCQPGSPNCVHTPNLNSATSAIDIVRQIESSDMASQQLMKQRLDKCCSMNGDMSACGKVGTDPGQGPPSDSGMCAKAEFFAKKLAYDRDNAVQRLGACRSLKIQCQNAYHNAFQRLGVACADNQGQGSDFTQECQAAQAQLGQDASVCNADEQPLIDAASKTNKGVPGAEAVANASGSEKCKDTKNPKDPSDPTNPDFNGGKQAGGDKPSGGDNSTSGDTPQAQKKAGKGLGGMNPMSLLAMAPALMQMMQPQPQPQANIPQPDLSANCGNGGAMVNGQCGPPQNQNAQTIPNSWNGNNSGKDGMQPASASTGSFNTGNVADKMTGITPNGMMTQPNVGDGSMSSGMPLTPDIVPNGGGQMLGSQDNMQPASLGQGAGVGSAMPRRNSLVPDISRFASRPSQYAAQAQAMTATTAGGGGWSGYGKGDDNNPGYQGFPLADFLPGAKRGPAMAKLVGGIGGGAPGVQIQSRDVNIWARISDHIHARCIAGLLRDCNY